MSGKVNLDRWGPHLAAAKREGKTLTQYARGRGLSRHTLYAARQRLRGLEGKAGARTPGRASGEANEREPSAFAAVKLLTPRAALGEAAPRLRAQLPNGVRLELAWEGAEPALLAAAIEALAGR